MSDKIHRTSTEALREELQHRFYEAEAVGGS